MFSFAENQTYGHLLRYLYSTSMPILVFVGVPVSHQFSYNVCIAIVEYPTTIFGDAMKQQVEDRLKFYETGEVPRKNVEVMGTAVEEVRLTCKQY